MLRSQQYINGEWRNGRVDKTLVDHNPYTGAPFTKFEGIASPADIDDAYQAAALTKVTWDKTNPYEKQVVFDRAITFVMDRAEEITEFIIDELGGTRLKAGFEIGLVLDTLREAATLPLRVEGRILASQIHDRENRIYREPVGVVGVISPSNFPFFLGMKPVAAALALGNGVVLKPHEDSPVTGGTLIGAIFEEAGLPAGLLNVVVTEIPAIGDTFVEHKIPRVIVFTGSASVGAHVASVAARNFKKPIVEAGGNSPFIVLEDAHLGLAIDAAVFSRFTHQGQVCMAANRVLVHRSIYDEFTQRFVAKAESLPVGNPRDEDTIIGPLINQAAVDKLMAQVEIAIGEGARPVLRGRVNGLLVHPTVLADVTPAMSIAQQELFGPVVCLMPFDTEDEAVEIANDTPFGLSGAIHTRNLHNGEQLAHRIHTGMIHINDATIHDEPIVPFGGEGHSGIGRLNGDANLYELTTPKWISINHGRRQFPY